MLEAKRTKTELEGKENAYFKRGREENMTAEEVRKQYKVPVDVLKIYENHVRKSYMGKKNEERDYDDQDLEQLGRIMTLKRFGFKDQEIGIFFHLEMGGETTKDERLRMLKRQRLLIVDQIHQKEKILGELDYLRYKLDKTNGMNEGRNNA